MELEFDKERPIYMQIMERIKSRILSGVYAPGERLLSVRELAVEMAVNPNTMQKALSELEREGLLHAQRTAGRYITEDEALLRSLKEQAIKQEAEAFLKRLREMGITRDEIMSALEAAGKEMEAYDTDCHL